MYNKNFTIFVGAKRNSGKGYEEYEGYKVIYFHNSVAIEHRHKGYITT